MTYELRDRHVDDVLRSRHHEACAEQLSSAQGLLFAAIDDIKASDDIASVYEGKNTAPEASSIMKLINITERKLRKVIHKIPDDEKEVQDAFEALLIGADIEYDREKVTFKYSSRAYRPDFTMDHIDLAVEIKICTSAAREKDLIPEINDDILAYKTKYGNVIFVIYDLGFIRDVDKFASEFERQENVVVRVIKH